MELINSPLTDELFPYCSQFFTPLELTAFPLPRPSIFVSSETDSRASKEIRSGDHLIRGERQYLDQRRRHVQARERSAIVLCDTPSVWGSVRREGYGGRRSGRTGVREIAKGVQGDLRGLCGGRGWGLEEVESPNLRPGQNLSDDHPFGGGEDAAQHKPRLLRPVTSFASPVVAYPCLGYRPLVVLPTIPSQNTTGV